MRKRTNERYEEEKKFKFDEIFTCDACGKESKQKFEIKFGLPAHSHLMDPPMFCSFGCLKDFWKGKSGHEMMKELEKEVKHYGSYARIEDDYEQEWEGGLWMPFEAWKELFKEDDK